MEFNPNLLWNKENKIYIISYKKVENTKISSNKKNKKEIMKLVERIADLFNFHKAVRITGSLSIYTQIPNKSRLISDVDININELNFIHITKLITKKGYSLCRLAQRELKDGIRTCVFEEIKPSEFIIRKPSVRTVFLKKNIFKQNHKKSPLDIIDIFVNYIDKNNWECTYDHRINPIIPEEFEKEIILPKGNIRTVSLKYMAILLKNEDLFGIGNKLDREKNKYDLNVILKNIKNAEEIKEILKKRKTIK